MQIERLDFLSPPFEPFSKWYQASWPDGIVVTFVEWEDPETTAMLIKEQIDAT